MNGDDALSETVDFCDIAVDTSDSVAHFRKAGAGHEADVSRADDIEVH